MNRNSGFTLMEILVAIALAAVFAAVAVPSYRRLVADNRITATMNGFAGTLAEARSEAVRRGETVIVCPSSDSTTTTPTCNSNTGTADWSNGWISYVHAASHAGYAYDPSQQDVLLRVHGAVGDGVTLTSTSGGGSVANYIGFNRMGFAQPTFGGGTTSLAVVACPSGGDLSRARAVLLDLSGSVRSATDTTGDGVVDNANGTDVTCP